MYCRQLFAIAAVVFAGGSFTLAADETAGASNNREDVQAIRAAANEYLKALERGDAKTLAELWTEDGDFIDDSGRSFPAREIIAQESKRREGDARPEIKLTDNSIRFLTPDVAIEDGNSEVTRRDASPALRGRFSAIWVRRDGRWRLSSLREARINAPVDRPKLSDLDWMTGDWSGQHDDLVVEMSARWNETHTFLIRELSVFREKQLALHSTQWIGWNPLEHRIIGWTFDSFGGYANAAWSRRGDSWVVETAGVSPDGKHTSSASSYTPQGKDSFTWTSKGAGRNEQPPEERTIKLERKSAEK